MQNDLFESAFKYSAIGIALVSPTGHFLKVNTSLLRLLGYSEDELLRSDFLQLTHPEDLKADLDLVNETLLGQRESYQMEKRYYHKDGSVIYAILSVSLIRNDDASPRFFISQIQDVTELKKTQVNLQANSKMVALGELAASIAHEVNNPLTIISLNAHALSELVQETQIDFKRVRQFTGTINDTITRISSIVSSLRKFSNDSSKLRSFEKCSIQSIVDDAIGLCSGKFRLTGVTLEILIPEYLEIECNPFDISQVLINLINNAFYVVQEQDVKEISIAVTEHKGRVFLSVMDSGPGIAEDIKSRLMEPFFTTKPIGQGTGLGLSISKNIALVHQGDLYVDGSSDRTKFVLELPVKQSSSRGRLDTRVSTLP